jgi:hypothetical protein
MLGELGDGSANIAKLPELRQSAVGQDRRVMLPEYDSSHCSMASLPEQLTDNRNAGRQALLRVACRRCNGFWYAAQRTCSDGRKALAKRKIRRKLGDHGQLWAVKFPPKPRGMWRRTYARHCAALDRIERNLT